MKQLIKTRQNRRLMGWLISLFILFAGLTPYGIFAQTSTITLKTSKSVGDKVTLIISAEGDVKISGVSNPNDYRNASKVAYTITEQTISIEGNITKLECSDNKISSLTLSNCVVLNELKCHGNDITSLDVSGSPELEWLKCNNNQLSSLNASNCKKLEAIFCYDNLLPSINIAGCTKLTKLGCELNQIKDQEMDKLIESLHDRSNETNSGLFYVLAPTKGNEQNICNKIQVVNAKNKNWRVLYLKEDKKWYDYEGSSVSEIIIMTTAKKAGETIDLNIEATGNVVITGVTNPNDYRNGNKISYRLKGSMIALSGDITKLECENNSLTDLNVSDNTKLKYLKCSDNSLTRLSAVQCQTLEQLDCKNNNITTLDISDCSNLKKLDCSANKIISLTTPNCKMLQEINCIDNLLMVLNVSDCTDLKSLYCSENQIRGLEMTDLVKSLCDRVNKDKGHLYVVNESASDERNLCDKNQVATAKSKNWEVMYIKNSDWIVYEGSEPRPIASITLTTEKAINEPIVLGIIAIGNVRISGVSNPDDYKKDPFMVYTITDQKVTLEGDIRQFDCSNNELSSLELKDCIDLTDLSCYDNKISSLKLSGCQSLKKIICEKNQIKEAAMSIMVDNLPDRSAESNKGELVVINLNSAKEGNVMNTNQVAAAKKKNWNIKCTKDGYTVDYEGSPVNIENITNNTVNIFPNPAKETINIEGLKADILVSLHTMDGNTVITTKTTHQGQAILNVSSLPRGIYLLHIEGNYRKVILE